MIVVVLPKGKQLNTYDDVTILTNIGILLARYPNERIISLDDLSTTNLQPGENLYFACHGNCGYLEDIPAVPISSKPQVKAFSAYIKEISVENAKKIGSIAILACHSARPAQLEQGHPSVSVVDGCIQGLEELGVVNKSVTGCNGESIPNPANGEFYVIDPAHAQDAHVVRVNAWKPVASHTQYLLSTYPLATASIDVRAKAIGQIYEHSVFRSMSVVELQQRHYLLDSTHKFSTKISCQQQFAPLQRQAQELKNHPLYKYNKLTTDQKSAIDKLASATGITTLQDLSSYRQQIIQAQEVLHQLGIQLVRSQPQYVLRQQLLTAKLNTVRQKATQEIQQLTATHTPAQQQLERQQQNILALKKQEAEQELEELKAKSQEQLKQAEDRQARWEKSGAQTPTQVQNAIQALTQLKQQLKAKITAKQIELEQEIQKLSVIQSQDMQHLKSQQHEQLVAKQTELSQGIDNLNLSHQQKEPALVQQDIEQLIATQNAQRQLQQLQQLQQRVSQLQVSSSSVSAARSTAPKVQGDQVVAMEITKPTT